MEKLVNMAKRGDTEAFTQLMQSQMQNMYKTARSILSQDEDVADAISDTILAWMTRILVNKCYDLIRANKTVAWEDYIPDPAYREQEYENIEWKQTLDSLSEKYRLIMMLYYVEGFKVSEISQILDLSEGTVKSRLSRGRERLTEAFELRQRRAN